MKKSFEQVIVNNLKKMPDQKVREVLIRECSQKELLEAILSSISYAIIVFDENDSIKYINSTGARFFLSNWEKLAGRKYESLNCDPLLKEVIDYVLKENSKLTNHELALNTPNNIIVSISSFPLVWQGGVSGNIIIIDDITENYNSKIRRYHKDSIESLGVLTAGVAHEIKNPLGALDLHIQLINRVLNKRNFQGKGELKEYVAVLEDEIGRLDKIVNDFLFSVRPIKPTLKPENLNEIINETLDVLQPELSDKKIEVQLSLSHKIPIFNLDKNYLKQAFLNIIQNGIYAIREVRKSGIIKISSELKGDKVIVSVADDGKGISKKNLNKIFEPFFSTKEMGTGLGLTIVYKIIQEHNGEIIISSETGKGTDFRVEFNLRKPLPKLITHKRTS